MTTAEVYEENPQLLQHDLGSVTLERFDALCWCAAMKYNNKKYLDEGYDMFFCNEDFSNGDELCPNYHAVRKL